MRFACWLLASLAFVALACDEAARHELGSGVELWSYRTTNEWGGERVAGTTELYFVDRSAVISGLGFAPDGVVYEGGQGGS